MFILVSGCIIGRTVFQWLQNQVSTKCNDQQTLPNNVKHWSLLMQKRGGLNIDNLNMTLRDYNDLWKEIDNQRVLFHPTIAPDGHIVEEEFKRHRSELSIIIDNNILIDLISLCRNGYLNDKERMRSTASLMLWVELYKLSMTSGQAMQEKAARFDSTALLDDFSIFKRLWNDYSPQQWQLLRHGDIAELPIIDGNSVIKSDVSIYMEKPDAYYQAYASVLKIVSLLRDGNHNGFQRARSFIEWSYNNTRVSKYIIAYGLLLLMGKEEGIKVPKKAFSTNVTEVFKGCENQAWDLASISAWSQLLYMKEQGIIPDMYMFATRDMMLKRILEAVIKSNDMMPLFQSVFNRRELNEILDIISKLRTQEKNEKLDSLINPDSLRLLALSEENNLKKIISSY